MLKKIILITLVFSLTFTIFAQNNNDLPAKQKSAKKAMLLSSLFPGAGQYYADKSNLATYIFPLLEIGLWTGYIVYHQKGLDKESDYQDYADTYYKREYQERVQSDITQDPNASITFYSNHFRLDEENTQHFYEDIGKYSKYVFGWVDWYEVYATSDGATFCSPNWIWDEETGIMEGVGDPNNPTSEYYVGDEDIFQQNHGLHSRKLVHYVEMRKDAEDLYDIGRYFSYGILANHFASALHAHHIAVRHNTELAQNVRLQVAPVLVNNHLSPAIMFSTRF